MTTADPRVFMLPNGNIVVMVVVSSSYRKQRCERRISWLLLTESKPAGLLAIVAKASLSITDVRLIDGCNLVIPMNNGSSCISFVRVAGVCSNKIN
jgi:hypothetical protein